jgi:hypothetical protein
VQHPQLIKKERRIRISGHWLAVFHDVSISQAAPRDEPIRTILAATANIRENHAEAIGIDGGTIQPVDFTF